MHLVSKVEQSITLNGEAIDFKSGESIHTENSYKYDLDQFYKVAEDAGFKRLAVWTDKDELFSVQFFRTK
jgi:uncharacterized SAM-dependent methyltransferase